MVSGWTLHALLLTAGYQAFFFTIAAIYRFDKARQRGHSSSAASS